VNPLYLFLETHDVAEQRGHLEGTVGLPVVETDLDRGHRHGVVKYDAGPVLLALNLAPARRFQPRSSDAMTMVFGSGSVLHTDRHGHHVLLDDAPAPLASIRLRVRDVVAAVAFYREMLGLTPAQTAQGIAMLTPTVPIVLESGVTAADGRAVRHDTYTLVFHTDDVRATRSELSRRGLVFTGRDVAVTPIGSTARFTDVAGHHVCLYEPSPEALAWPSGAVIRRILSGASAPAPSHHFPR